MPQRHIPFRTTATAAVVTALLLLSGCGSSHHSSTSSSENLVPGTYRGPATLTLTGGGQSASQSGEIVMRLNDNGTVQVGQFPAVPLQGNTFVASLPYTFFNQNPQLHCTSGTYSVNGTFAGATVSGQIFSNALVCNGVAFVFTGSYTAQLSASESRRGGAPEGDELGDLSRQLLEQVRPK